ncbi:hypothetical protein ACHAWF_010875 [Thalassiosira exigua]
MTCHNISKGPNLAFDELDYAPASPEMNADASMPVAVPVSPCPSECSESDSIMTDAGLEGKYALSSKVLGTGHYGSVRECVDRRTGVKYAVKTMSKKDKKIKSAAIAREIELLECLDHHGVIRLVDLYEDDDAFHLVTDLCEGGELFDAIVSKASDKESRDPCFSEDDAARILRQVLEAVAYMHRRGVVHRDIKPENILFSSTSDDSPVKIVDFGLARPYRDGREPPMSTIVGTPYYIAPEVLRKKYGPSCDLWSVGVVAYILLCGYPPFNGRTNEQTHRAVSRGMYRFPSEEWSYVSDEAMDFVRRLLQMDPRRRMTAEEALRHPWVAGHGGRDAADPAMSEEECSLESEASVEYVKVFKPTTPKKSGRVRAARRKMRKAMFGI